MIDMSTWEDVSADVIDDLHLDPRNVRLEQPHGVPESDIIRDLFSNEKAFNLVEAIAQVGYLTHELPIVVIRGDDIIVVEGNRRLAALKAIQNPYLAPDHRAKITRLIDQIPNRDALKVIKVKIAPSQDEADQLIAALHTGNQRVAWTPTRQAAFFQAQIDAGKTLPQLLAQYPTIDVKDFVIRSKMLEVFRSVRYQDPDLKGYVSTRRFPVSTLARLYEYDKFLELVQIHVNYDKAAVTLKGAKQQFSVLAEKIIADIKSKRIDTRVLNSTQSDSYKAYMTELRDLINEPPPGKPAGGATQPNEGGGPGQTGSGTGNAQPPGGGAQGSATGGEGARGTGSPASSNEKAGQGKAKASTASYLDTDGLDASGFPTAISLILVELSSISVNRFPNAAFDLLRTFLEKTIKAYSSNLGEEIRNTANLNGYVQLSHALTWLEQHLRGKGERSLIQVVQKVRSGRIADFISSQTHLNAINHNHLIFATPGDVRDCWNTMKPLLQFMLKS